MKPQEFNNCTFKEASLFANSYIREQERKLKEQIVLYENITDKELYNNPNNVKRPAKIKLIDIYEELFKEDFDKMIESGKMKPRTKEAQEKFVLELQEEIKGGAK